MLSVDERGRDPRSPRVCCFPLAAGARTNRWWWARAGSSLGRAGSALGFAKRLGLRCSATQRGREAGSGAGLAVVRPRHPPARPGGSEGSAQRPGRAGPLPAPRPCCSARGAARPGRSGRCPRCWAPCSGSATPPGSSRCWKKSDLLRVAGGSLTFSV